MQTKKTDPFSVIASKFMIAAHDLVSRETGHSTLFTLGEEEVIALDIGSGNGLLPVFVWQADRIHYRVSNMHFGFKFCEDVKSLTGFRIDLDSGVEANSEVLLYLVEALDECRLLLRKSDAMPHAVALDDLVAQFQTALTNEMAPVRSVSVTRAYV